MREPSLTPPPTLAAPTNHTVVPAKAGTQGRGAARGRPSPAVAHPPPTVVPAQAGTSPSATRTSAPPTPRRRGGSRTARPARAGLPLRHQQPSPARPLHTVVPAFAATQGRAERARGRLPLPPRPHPQEREINTHSKQPHKNKTAPDIPAKTGIQGRHRNPGQPQSISPHPPPPNASFLRRQESRGAGRVGQDHDGAAE